MAELGSVTLKQAVDMGLLPFYVSNLDNAGVFKRSNAWSLKHLEGLKAKGITCAGDLVSSSEANLRSMAFVGPHFVDGAPERLMQAFSKVSENGLPDFVLKDNGTMGHMLGVKFDDSLKKAIELIKSGKESVATIAADVEAFIRRATTSFLRSSS